MRLSGEAAVIGIVRREGIAGMAGGISAEEDFVLCVADGDFEQAAGDGHDGGEDHDGEDDAAGEQVPPDGRALEETAEERERAEGALKTGLDDRTHYGGEDEEPP